MYVCGSKCFASLNVKSLKDIIENELIPKITCKNNFHVTFFTNEIHLTWCLWSGKRVLINLDT